MNQDTHTPQRADISTETVSDLRQRDILGFAVLDALLARGWRRATDSPPPPANEPVLVVFFNEQVGWIPLVARRSAGGEWTTFDVRGEHTINDITALWWMALPTPPQPEEGV